MTIPMESIEMLRKRHIWLLNKSAETLDHILAQVSQADAETLRDGPDGWTTLEVLAHLRDFNDIFRERAQMMLTQDHPQLPGFDHEAMAIERRYNEESLPELMTAYLAARQAIVDFFRGLTPEDWARGGIHPERGDFYMMDALIQAGLHDIDHTEQITRILLQR